MPSPELHFNNVVDVKPWMSRISLDVAGNFILSHDFQTIHGNQEFYNAWHSNEKRGTFSQFTWQGLSLEWIKRLFPTPQDKQITSAGIYIRNAVSRIVDERLRQYKRLDKIPEDVLGQMITMGESTREEYIEQAVFAIGVAFDTIANLLSCALYHIAKRPVLQPTLRAEIRHAGERSSVSGDIYRRMPALTAIILEASRLHPPIPVTIRKVVRNTRIKGTFNAAHWGVAATLSSSGHMMLWEATLTERYYKTADTLVDKLAQTKANQSLHQKPQS
ncbi:cytochrome P450 [Aspergillus bertholletiae]|uniref:Cytochrome P450 n=1 Tax=Aspergillus bertholletiae TaxID=1226010 RepID=A0A5N7AQZ0_9EURO|nr:cytochrome P450 [Aspergillus bertholletiae]